MSGYGLIFYNSMQASLLFSFRSENAWFAALDFGGYNMLYATVFALMGSTLGMSLNFLVGYYVSRWRDELPAHSESRFQKAASLFRRKLFLIMIIPPIPILEGIPGISFMPFYVFVNGLFRVPIPKAIITIACARVLFYSYFLLYH